MVRIEVTEWAKYTPIESLNELVINANGIGVLGSKWLCCIQNTLLVLDCGSSNELAIGTGR